MDNPSAIPHSLGPTAATMVDCRPSMRLADQRSLRRCRRDWVRQAQSRRAERGCALSHDAEILAVGLLDTPGLLRLAIAPGAQHAEEFARQMVADVTQPERGALPQGHASIEARFGGPFGGLRGGLVSATACTGPPSWSVCSS
jgi:hypothetical protein